MQSLGDDDEVGIDGRAVAQLDGDLIAMVGEIGDLGVESIVGTLGGALNQDAR